MDESPSTWMMWRTTCDYLINWCCIRFQKNSDENMPKSTRTKMQKSIAHQSATLCLQWDDFLRFILVAFFVTIHVLAIFCHIIRTTVNTKNQDWELIDVHNKKLKLSKTDLRHSHSPHRLLPNSSLCAHPSSANEGRRRQRWPWLGTPPFHHRTQSQQISWR